MSAPVQREIVERRSQTISSIRISGILRRYFHLLPFRSPFAGVVYSNSPTEFKGQAILTCHGDANYDFNLEMILPCCWHQEMASGICGLRTEDILGGDCYQQKLASSS